MLAVILSAIVSVGVAWFALAIVLREFHGRGAQVAAALAFDERAFISGDVRSTAAPRAARLAPARIRRQSTQRAAA